MFFRRALWLLGAAMSLESMRRGFIGGSALSLFIIKEFGLERQAVPTMDRMRIYLELEGSLLDQIPDFLAFLFYPFSDYHLAATTYLEILDILSESQRPRTCEYYWKE